MACVVRQCSALWSSFTPFAVAAELSAKYHPLASTACQSHRGLSQQSIMLQVPPHASASGLERHHSLPVGNPMSPFYSQTSCNAGPMELDHSLSLDLGPNDTVLSLDLGATETVLDAVPAFGKICFDGLPGCLPPKSPPIDLQLRKSESFLDLINEHLKHANSA